MRHLRFTALANLACAVAMSIMLSAGAVLADPQTKVVTGDSVRTRSGPGEYWYPTGKLNRGDTVVVVGKQFGWTEIKPPADQRSLILKSDVDLTSQLDPGGTGVVKGDQPVAVRACPIEEARSNRIQCYLRPRAQVIILNPWEKFYLIAPPAGATVFIKTEFLAEPGTVVEPTHTGPITAHGPTSGPDTTAALSTSQPETIDTVATTSTTQPVATIVGLDIRARVAEDQKLIKEQLAKPMAERDFSVLVARMEELKVQNARAPIRGVPQYADAMIAYVNRQTKLAAMVRTMAVTRPDIDQVLRDAEAAMAVKPADFFQAVGILNKSVALGSSLSMPNLHKLESMDGQSVLCYVVPEDNADWSMFEGKSVQVTGKKHYRADWKIYLVRPDKIALADKTGPVPVPQPPPGTGMELSPEEIQKVIDAAAGIVPSTTAPDNQPETPRVPLPAPAPTPAPVPAPAVPVPPAGPEGTLRPLPPVAPDPVIPTLPGIPAPSAPTSAPVGP